jgi:hypothetical protein
MISDYYLARPDQLVGKDRQPMRSVMPDGAVRVQHRLQHGWLFFSDEKGRSISTTLGYCQVMSNVSA